MQIRKRYDVYIPTDGFLSIAPSETIQSFKDECDVNMIVAGFDHNVMQSNITGSTIEPQFGDFTGIPDLQDSYNMIISAKADFDVLPLEIRERFNYDASKFLAFVSNPDNFDEMVSLGLATKHVEPETSPPVVQSPEPSPASAD